MRAANLKVMKRRDVAVSAVSHGARRRKRDEKSDGRKEKPALRPITHMRVKQIAEARVVQEREDDRDRQKNGKSKTVLGNGREDGLHCAQWYGRRTL
jgi:hypothetical protein